jgi:Ser/Thr protein kinase RdoA (MazF antagonist)
MMLNELLTANYDIEINNLNLVDSYFGTEIYFAESDNGRYIVKLLPLSVPGFEKEGHLTEFLYKNGIPVARLLKTKNGGHAVKTDNTQFHVQEFIEGDVFKVNTAPEWLVEGSARILGKIHAVLQNYHELSINFGEDFFRKENAMERKQYYIDQLNEATNIENTSLNIAFEERIKHLERISAFNIKPEKLTYANSHGDFYIGQIIIKDEKITVIDWTSACKLPAALEVVMSYVFAAPECKHGRISGDGLKQYIEHYSQHFHLNDYDIMIMPRLFYFQQIMCHYPPPYDSIPDMYKQVCKLINSFTGWLYKNTEMLERELQK